MNYLPRFSFEHILVHSFCVWLLLYDGMYVSPFDRHKDGNGLLRLYGLRPPTWELLLQHAMDIPATFEQIGTPELAAHLLRPWTAYDMVHWQEWQTYYTSHRPPFLSNPLDHLAFAHTLHRDLVPLSSSLSALTISLVQYPAPVVYPLRPSTVLLGADHDEWDATIIRTNIVQAAKQLVDS